VKFARALRSLLCLLGLWAVLAACGSSAAAEPAAGPGFAPAAAGQPRLLMIGPTRGFLLWTSGPASVLLATTDGFRTFTNATPPAVPTQGGLILGRDGRHLVVGVLPTGGLTTSPFLVGDGSRPGWSGGQLPGTVANWPDSVALQGSTVWALVGTDRAGRLVESSDGGVSWTESTLAGRLDPSGQLWLTGVTWTDRAHGWLAGAARAGQPVLFASRPGGSGWLPVPLAPMPGTVQGATEAATVPCAAGTGLWTLLVVQPSTGGAGSAVVERSGDAGASWVAGNAVAGATGQPVLGCGQGQLWLAVPGAPSGHLMVSSDGGSTWQDQGATPGAVTSLAVTGLGSGLAVTGAGNSARLWSVSENGGRFTPIPLPAWVARLASGRQS
jgi:hypothetical protein